MKSIFACYGMYLFHFLVFFFLQGFYMMYKNNVCVKTFTLIVALFLHGLKLVTWGLHLHLHLPEV